MTPPRPPVGYLINGKGGLQGEQGTGYDYVLAGNGIFLQAENRLITARIQLAQAEIRGLAATETKLELRHGKAPLEMLWKGIQWFQETPDQERYFAIRWNGKRHELVRPEQQGRAARVTYTRIDDAVIEFHSHGRIPAFFSNTDDEDEQGFRIYGVAGQLGKRPELRLRMGIYGHFGKVEPEEIFE